jgi:hypothetical protein
VPISQFRGSGKVKEVDAHLIANVDGNQTAIGMFSFRIQAFRSNVTPPHYNLFGRVLSTSAFGNRDIWIGIDLVNYPKRFKSRVVRAPVSDWNEEFVLGGEYPGNDVVRISIFSGDKMIGKDELLVRNISFGDNHEYYFQGFGESVGMEFFVTRMAQGWHPRHWHIDLYAVTLRCPEGLPGNLVVEIAPAKSDQRRELRKDMTTKCHVNDINRDVLIFQGLEGDKSIGVHFLGLKQYGKALNGWSPFEFEMGSNIVRGELFVEKEVCQRCSFDWGDYGSDYSTDFSDYTNSPPVSDDGTQRARAVESRPVPKPERGPKQIERITGELIKGEGLARNSVLSVQLVGKCGPKSDPVVEQVNEQGKGVWNEKFVWDRSKKNRAIEVRVCRHDVWIQRGRKEVKELEFGKRVVIEVDLSSRSRLVDQSGKVWIDLYRCVVGPHVEA